MKTGIKMRVTPEQSRKVQEIVFENGGVLGDPDDRMRFLPILSIDEGGLLYEHYEEEWPTVAGEAADADVFIATNGEYTQAAISPVYDRTDESATQSRGAGLKYDAGKLRYSLVPPEALRGIAEVLTFGAEKYEPNSWQEVENAEERYLDALIRHIEAYRSGEALDPESGLHHLKHAACNVAFLIYFEETSARITD